MVHLYVTVGATIYQVLAVPVTMLIASHALSHFIPLFYELDTLITPIFTPLEADV